MVINPIEYITDRAFRLQGLIEHAQSKEYSTKVPHYYLSELLKLIQLFKNRIERYPMDIKSIRRIEYYYEMIHFYLDDIDHITSTNIPLEYLPLLTEILRENGSSSEIVLRPDTDYNYTFNSFTEITVQMCTYLGFTPSKSIAIIGFPLCEKDNYLQNSILFHELGHQLILEKDLIKKINKKYLTITVGDIDDYYNSLRARFATIQQSLDLGNIGSYFVLEEDYQKSRLVEELNDILNDWMHEIASDLLAFYYIGPAYLLSIAELSYIKEDPKAVSTTHPPLFLRLKAMFKLYNRLKYSNKLKQYGNITKHIAQYKKISLLSYSTDPAVPEILKYLVIEKKVSKSINEVIRIINQEIKIKRNAYNQIHIDDAVNSYLNMIPPNEYFTKDSKKNHTPFSIINSALIVLYNQPRQLNKIYKSRQESIFAINKLLAKALESVQFSNRMEGKP